MTLSTACLVIRKVIQSNCIRHCKTALCSATVDYSKKHALHLPPFTERRTQPHVDLLELVGVPLPPSVSFTQGYEDGGPAYSFGPDSNIGRLARSFVPSPFYRDFAVLATVRPSSARGGVLFAVTDAKQEVVRLGLEVRPARARYQNVVLHYSEGRSHKLTAVFTVAPMTEEWAMLSVVVEGDQASLTVDCGPAEVVPLARRSGRVSFHQESGIFVANAGSAGMERFVVSLCRRVCVCIYGRSEEHTSELQSR